jgi:PAS domain S-box-containing protein
VDSQEKVSAQLSEAARDGARFEFDHRRKDGSRFPVEVMVHPGYIDGEKLLVSVIRDISYRRNLEGELRRLNAELEERVELKTRESLELYHNAPCGYHAVNASGIVEQMNARELSWLGYLESEVVGKMAFVDLLLPEDGIKFKEIFPRFVESGQMTTAQWRMRRKDGSILPVFVTVRAIRDAEGRFIKTQASSIDVSEREQIEEDLRKARDAAEAASRAKTTFLANISHELRTPLNAIIGFSELLQKDVTLVPKSREHVRTISRSGQHLIEIIGDVLEMARIEAGNVGLRSVRFELEPVLDDLKQFFLESTQKKGLVLQVELSPENPGMLLGDVTKVRQVLINLVGNAVKFTSAGTICVRIVWARDSDGNCRLDGEVSDTGPGIRHEDIVHLFKPFFQTDLGYSAKGGTGLGLRITREYLHRMGGDISVSSEPGQGSCFQFHFQLKFATPATVTLSHVNEGDRVPDQGPSARGDRVLVVDDQPDNRSLLLNILEPLGYVVVEAVDGLDAIEKFTATVPKFVLMDLQMPRMDGCQAIREIRNLKTGEVFIIAISAGVVSEKFQIARQAGADACLGKPFKDAELLRLMVRVSENVQPNVVSDGLVRNGGPMDQELRERMLQLSPKWIQGLVSSARNAEYRKLTALVDEIREVDPELASGLSSRVEAFDYESVLQLLNSQVAS